MNNLLPISNEEISSWQKLGSRATYGLCLKQIAQLDKDVIAISADLLKSSGLDRMQREFPSQTINAGIAEQNMVAMAAGMADAGLKPYVSSFAPFLTQRANEQIRMNLGYMRSNVKLVAIGSGLSMGFLGNSHYGTEDIAALRSIPNIEIYSPADTTSLVQILDYVHRFSAPTYIRLTGVPGYPLVYTETPEEICGPLRKLRDGNQGIIFATGSMVRQALDAQELLKEFSIELTVIDVYKLKPLTFQDIEKFMDVSLPVITVEEHSIIGGLGSAIAEIMSQVAHKKKHLRIGLADSYQITSDYYALLDFHKLTANLLAERIKCFFSILD
jgi:transketolase